MINPISFTSTYKINYDSRNVEDIYKHIEVDNFCTGEKLTRLNVYQPSSSQTIIVSDEKDKMVESFLAQTGIDYKKILTEELLSIPNILSRIKPAPQKQTLALIDSEKLEELLQNQPNNNFSHVQSDYERYFRREINTQIRSGDEIGAPALYLNPTSRMEDFSSYVDFFGADRLNPDSMCITLCKTDFDTGIHDYATYFALKDLGMKDIPVYLDDESYEVAEKLGLIVDNNQF